MEAEEADAEEAGPFAGLDDGSYTEAVTARPTSNPYDALRALLVEVAAVPGGLLGAGYRMIEGMHDFVRLGTLAAGAPGADGADAGAYLKTHVDGARIAAGTLAKPE